MLYYSVIEFIEADRIAIKISEEEEKIHKLMVLSQQEISFSHSKLPNQ